MSEPSNNAQLTKLANRAQTFVSSQKGYDHGRRRGRSVGCLVVAPLGPNPRRRRRGARPRTSSVDSATVFRRVSPLYRRSSSRLYTVFVTPMVSHDDRKPQRFRSAAALATDRLFGDHRIGPPVHENGSQSHQKRHFLFGHRRFGSLFLGLNLNRSKFRSPETPIFWV